MYDDNELPITLGVAGGYHGFDALWEEEAVVECVHCVVWLDSTLLLQQDWSGVQSIVSPEHGEASFLIPLDQSPGNTKSNTDNSRINDVERCYNTGILELRDIKSTINLKNSDKIKLMRPT